MMKDLSVFKENIVIMIVLLYLKECFTCNNYLDYCDAMEEDDGSAKYSKVNTWRSAITEQERIKVVKNMSETLNNLFGSVYNRQVRPGVGENTTLVEVALAIRSMGPVDDNTENITFDCYFRQKWEDKRLKFNNTLLDELPMNWKFLSYMWSPDTFFLNGKESYLHKMSVPNRFIRISQDGQISYSQRLTVTAKCSLNLIKYPFDFQICPLVIGSFGYPPADVKYIWAKSPLSMGKIRLSQHALVNWTFGSSSTYFKNGNRSTIFLKFQFKRTLGFYLLQLYIPLIIIVMSSWVSFWLVRTEQGKETPARTGLVGSCTLAVVTMGLLGETKPQDGYATALDIFILLCFIFVFLALVEFAFINFVDVFMHRLKMRDIEKINTMNEVAISITAPLNISLFQIETLIDHVNDESCGTGPDLLLPEKLKKLRYQNCDSFEVCNKIWLESLFLATDNILKKLNLMNWIHHSCLYHETSEVLYNVDYYSRRIFPSIFLILNLAYWTLYIYIL